MIRIFWGAWILLFATPTFIRTIGSDGLERWVHVISGLVIACAVSVMWPKRWLND